MSKLKQLLVVAALSAATTVLAECPFVELTFPKGDDGPGVIGKRYADVGFRIQDPQQYPDYAYAFGVSANIPLNKHVDVGVGYSNSWLDYTPQGFGAGENIDSSAHSFGASITVYSSIEDGIKPFITASLAHTMATAKFLGADHDSTSQSWSVSAGAEFPYKWVSFIASLGYDDDFKHSSQSGQDWFVSGEINTWITSKIGAYVGLSYVRPMHNYVSSWVYGAGLRARF